MSLPDGKNPTKFGPFELRLNAEFPSLSSVRKSMRLSGPVYDRYQVELYLRYSRCINTYRESNRTLPPNLSRGRKIEFIN